MSGTFVVSQLPSSKFNNLLLRSTFSEQMILQGSVEGASPPAVQCISGVLYDACETANLRGGLY